MSSPLIYPQKKYPQVQLRPVLLGQKGLGLLILPPLWTPPFFIITSELYERYQASEPNKIDDILTADELKQVQITLANITGPQDTHIIVRSSAHDEGLQQRGQYISQVCENSVNSLLENIRDIFSRVQAYEGQGKKLAIIVQKYINIQNQKGHLSNERRLFKIKDTWLCELDSISGISTPQYEKFRTQNIEPAQELYPLETASLDDIKKKLKTVAKWANNISTKRFHFEWIKDKDRLWIVQADRVSDLKGKGPSALYRKYGQANYTSEFKHLVKETNVSKGIWAKLDRIKEFREYGLPTTNLWVLKDQALIKKLSKGTIPDDLKQDLEMLVRHPVVIRTDVATADGFDSENLYLPRTEDIKTAEQAMEFLTKTSKELTVKKLKNIAFIFHYFIPAYASIYCYAKPKIDRVLIDAIWGLPDGLSFYPHDSFEVTKSGKIKKRIRCKEQFIDVTNDGRWVEKKAGTPWDWKQSVSDGDLKSIAKSSMGLANKLEKEIQVMWFVGIPDGIGHPKCLPWFFTENQLPESLLALNQMSTYQNTIMIRRLEDLEYNYDFNTYSAIRLRPIPDLLRSKEFIEKVSDISKLYDIPIILEGSTLQHAYYLLKNHNVRVVSSDPLIPEAEIRRFNKLVRDLIPSTIRGKGEMAEEAYLHNEELMEALKTKVLEEAYEVFWSNSSDSLKEEIVDLQHVVEALLHHLKVDQQEISEIGERKKRERGGFERGVFLKTTASQAMLKYTKTSIAGQSQLLEVPEQTKIKPIETNKPIKQDIAQPKVTLPLIPPPQKERHTGKLLELGNFGVVMNISYTEKDIVIQLDHIKENQVAEDSGQLKLKLD